MSMDEQLEQMKIFTTQLTVFNRNLTSELNSLARCHEQVSPYWQDSMRKQHDAVWLHLHENVVDYLKREAPAYEDFLIRKIRHLEEYLNG